MNTQQINLGEIIFYCKDCEEIVNTIKVGGKFVYKCKKCGTKNVAFGTKKSIYGFFRVEDKKKQEEGELQESPQNNNEENKNTNSAS